jgi:hypothetical protein
MGIFEKQSSSRTGVTQSVVSGVASATCTNPFGSQTYQIRVSCTAACYYKIVEAAGGAAAATDVFLPNNWVEYVTVTPGQKISAIQAPTNGLVTATVGTLSVTELS